MFSWFRTRKNDDSIRPGFSVFFDMCGQEWGVRVVSIKNGFATVIVNITTQDKWQQSTSDAYAVMTGVPLSQLAVSKTVTIISGEEMKSDV